MNAVEFVMKAESLVESNRVNIQTKNNLEKQLELLREQSEKNRLALDIATHAIEILNGISDDVVNKALEFLETELNAALDQMFVDSKRSIKIKQSMFRNQYPQLTFEVVTTTGSVRSLKSDSGHGLAQIVSLISTLSLIVITGARRFMILDEVISGVSVKNREIIDTILWSFADIGFQYIVNDHGYIPKGASVYEFKMVGDKSSCSRHWIEEREAE
jgi:hypothetical protein